ETSGAESRSEFSADSMLWVLSAFCQYFKTPFDPQLVTRELLPPLRSEVLLRIAELLEFRARWEVVSAKMLAKLRAPFAALLHPAANEPSLHQEPSFHEKADAAPPVFAF